MNNLITIYDLMTYNIIFLKHINYIRKYSKYLNTICLMLLFILVTYNSLDTNKYIYSV